MQPAGNPRGGEGAADKVALHQVTTEAHQQIPGGLILYAFSDDHESQVVTQADCRTHDRRVVAVAGSSPPSQLDRRKRCWPAPGRCWMKLETSSSPLESVVGVNAETPRAAFGVKRGNASSRVATRTSLEFARIEKSR